jgi:hypothetical protein
VLTYLPELPPADTAALQTDEDAASTDAAGADDAAEDEEVAA